MKVRILGIAIICCVSIAIAKFEQDDSEESYEGKNANVVTSDSSNIASDNVSCESTCGNISSIESQHNDATVHQSDPIEAAYAQWIAHLAELSLDPDSEITHIRYMYNQYQYDTLDKLIEAAEAGDGWASYLLMSIYEEMEDKDNAILWAKKTYVRTSSKAELLAKLGFLTRDEPLTNAAYFYLHDTMFNGNLLHPSLSGDKFAHIGILGIKSRANELHLELEEMQILESPLEPFDLRALLNGV